MARGLPWRRRRTPGCGTGAGLLRRCSNPRSPDSSRPASAPPARRAGEAPPAGKGNACAQGGEGRPPPSAILNRLGARGGPGGGARLAQPRRRPGSGAVAWALVPRSPRSRGKRGCGLERRKRGCVSRSPGLDGSHFLVARCCSPSRVTAGADGRPWLCPGGAGGPAGCTRVGEKQNSLGVEV